MAIEEEEGGEGLVLGGGGDLLRHGQVGEKDFDLCCAHVFGMAFVMEKDETFNPVNIGLFCAVRVVLPAQGIGDLFKQLLGALRYDFFLLLDGKKWNYILSVSPLERWGLW